MKPKTKDLIGSDDGQDSEGIDEIDKFYAEQSSVIDANLLGQQDETESEHEEVLAFSGSSSESATDDEQQYRNIPKEGETDDDGSSSESGTDDGQYDMNIINIPKEGETDDENEDIIKWGNRKENFYHRKGGEKEPTDEEDLKLEEFESLHQQKKILENIDETDGIFSEVKQLQNESSNQDTFSAITCDISGLTEEQKKQIVMREAPELQPLISDFFDKHGVLSEVLCPCANIISEYALENPFTKAVQNLVMLYSYFCSLYCFYFAMKARHETVKSHPVVEDILKVRKTFAEIEDKAKNVVEIAKQLIETPALAPRVFTRTEMQMKRVTVPVNAQIPKENEESADESFEKRPAGYDIVKNKGLMPKRKKKLRNPRVRHRRKFRRALIRRRAQVPEIRSRDRPYEGEPTGIKAGLKRSVKLN